MKLWIIIVTLSITGCGSFMAEGEYFRGEGDAAEGRESPQLPENAYRQPEVFSSDAIGDNTAEPFDPQTVLGSSSDDQKMLSCMQNWDLTGVTKDQVRNYRVMSSRKTGLGGTVILDSKKTSIAEFVLVKAATVGIGAINLKLLNPNGKYCLDVRQTGLGGRNITMHCGAEISSDRFANVGIHDESVDIIGNCE